MCLAIPVKLTAKEGDRGTVSIGGIDRAVDLRLLPEAAPGDYVILHAGFAIQRVDEREALETFDLVRKFEIEEP